MGLAEYRKKRNFTKTAEPAGQQDPSRQSKALLFVIQKHAASHLHYDFRLEMEGVLKSWAVPKGLPFRRGERRLAVQVEDHPFDYAEFEGTIAPGNYGAGTVMVWDIGTYESLGDDPLKDLAQGKIHLRLQGEKLQGEWTLVRMKRPIQAGKQEWLVLKSGADARPLPSRILDRSALSGRTLEEIAQAKDAPWQSNRAAKAKKRPRVTQPSVSAPKAAGAPKKLPGSKPAFIEPMKALLVDALPKGSDWIYEVKFDGYRALAVKNGASVKLISRNTKDLTGRYASIAEDLGELQAKQAVLDGELVAVDPEGRSSFQLLQSYQMPAGAKPPLFYYVFDLLHVDGRSLLHQPLEQRKAQLEELLRGMPASIRFSSGIQGNIARLINEMQKRGLEGLVAKLKHSKYEPGKRSGAWVKFKWTLEQEFVIGGFTPPKGGRQRFGAILAGYYEGKKLLFASKVGTGFNGKWLDSLHDRFQKVVQSACPFANLPESIPGGLGRSEMPKCTWLKPVLVCQVRFTEWTRDFHLRHPVFLGLREDKKASEVIRERPAR